MPVLRLPKQLPARWRDVSIWLCVSVAHIVTEYDTHSRAGTALNASSAHCMIRTLEQILIIQSSHINIHRARSMFLTVRCEWPFYQELRV